MFNFENIQLHNDAIQNEIDEAYDKDAYKKYIGKTYNQRKILKLIRSKRYGDPQLFAHTECINCHRQKDVFLSNLINDPEKYGSCICSDTAVDGKIQHIEDLYKGKKRLASNTSGYTGVSYIAKYNGEPYDRWRAYIEVDGVRTYLGDFKSKAKAIKARKEVAEKGVKWYRSNRNSLLKDMRKRSKKYQRSKYRESAKKHKNVTIKKK